MKSVILRRMICCALLFLCSLGGGAFAGQASLQDVLRRFELGNLTNLAAVMDEAATVSRSFSPDEFDDFIKSIVRGIDASALSNNDRAMARYLTVLSASMTTGARSDEVFSRAVARGFADLARKSASDQRLYTRTIETMSYFTTAVDNGTELGGSLRAIAYVFGGDGVAPPLYGFDRFFSSMHDMLIRFPDGQMRPRVGVHITLAEDFDLGGGYVATSKSYKGLLSQLKNRSKAGLGGRIAELEVCAWIVRAGRVSEDAPSINKIVVNKLFKRSNGSTSDLDVVGILPALSQEILTIQIKASESATRSLSKSARFIEDELLCLGPDRIVSIDDFHDQFRLALPSHVSSSATTVKNEFGKYLEGVVKALSDGSDPGIVKVRNKLRSKFGMQPSAVELTPNQVENMLSHFRLQLNGEYSPDLTFLQ